MIMYSIEVECIDGDIYLKQGDMGEEDVIVLKPIQLEMVYKHVKEMEDSNGSKQ